MREGRREWECDLRDNSSRWELTHVTKHRPRISPYTGCKNTRCSTEGNIFMVAGGPVSWETKRQDTVTLLTVETEFMAFSQATTQAL